MKREYEYTYYDGAHKVIASKSPVKDGKWDGICTFFYENGVVANKIRYKGNYADGIRRDFHPNGRLQVMYRYSRGRPVDGEYKEFDENGYFAFVNRWVKGHCQSFDRNGVLRRDFKDFNGCMVGKFREYYPNGQLKILCTYVAGDRDGAFTSFYPNGRVKQSCSFTKGEYDGEIHSYYDNGNLEYKAYFENGVLQGTEERYNSAGQLCISSLFVDGTCCGERRFYYDAGGCLRRKKDFVNGAPNGQDTIFHRNGEVACVYECKEGMIVDGWYKVYDEEGKFANEIEYKNETGRTYFESGGVKEEWLCYRGLINGLHSVYDESGKLVDSWYEYDSAVVADEREFRARTCEDLATKVVKTFENNGVEKNWEIIRDLFYSLADEASASVAALVKYDDYRDLPSGDFLHRIAREFVFRLRLPNDGETEKYIMRRLLECRF